MADAVHRHASQDPGEEEEEKEEEEKEEEEEEGEGAGNGIWDDDDSWSDSSEVYELTEEDDDEENSAAGLDSQRSDGGGGGGGRGRGVSLLSLLSRRATGKLNQVGRGEDEAGEHESEGDTDYRASVIIRDDVRESVSIPLSWMISCNDADRSEQASNGEDEGNRGKGGDGDGAGEEGEEGEPPVPDAKLERTLNKKVWVESQQRERRVRSLLLEEEQFLIQTLNQLHKEKQLREKRRREKREQRKGMLWDSSPFLDSTPSMFRQLAAAGSPIAQLQQQQQHKHSDSEPRRATESSLKASKLSVQGPVQLLASAPTLISCPASPPPPPPLPPAPPTDSNQTRLRFFSFHIPFFL